MDILIGIVIGVLLVLAVPAFFVIKWFLGDVFGEKGGRGFH